MKWPCPVKDCKYEGRSKSALFGHLYVKHRKSEIIEALLPKLKPIKAKQRGI